MTSENFIKICKKYAKENNKWLHPTNLEAILPFYQRFKKYCIENLRNEDDEDSVFDWLEDNRHSPDLMIENPSAINKGNDPTDGSKILILGQLKHEINPVTPIRRDNTKELIKEINAKIKEIVGYDTFFYEGGNHIEFKDKKQNDLYVIEWHFDPNYKEQNIVKRVCAELGITQRELAERIGMSADSLRTLSAKGQISTQTEAAINLVLENENLKKKLENYKALRTAIKTMID
ncbi:helix-turn-helix domain-containing protein [Campylobacter massiliensis]|uniref:helix-turn-helix domain-containing protein n=1 Tax=Campylobacter massiliensis TaxID=2762557 RepID=UPI001E62609E|nr:helix-turn-helix transcriptional regulator [Campylobacter massiliensis]